LAFLSNGWVFAFLGDSIPADASYKPGELLVRFAPKAARTQRSTAEKHEILSVLGGGIIKRDYRIVPGLSVVKLPDGMTVQDALKTFNKANGILYAEPIYRVKALSTFPNDPRFGGLWGMHNTGQTGGTPDADIDAPEAWDIGTGNGDIVVAVIDTGVDYTHPDLAANMWINPGEIPGNGIDDDNNGYVDDIYGYDFCNNDGDPMDDYFHGTHCAGTIGAVGNNGVGVAGVCWNVRIMALKFLSSEGSGYIDGAIACIEYSIDMGAKLSSNSWGGGGYDQALKDAIDAAGAAGMLFVAAAGNSNQNSDIYPLYPAAYDNPCIISVMATDHTDNKSWFSNYGPTSVDLGAPGTGILSTFPTYETDAMVYYGLSTNYETISGTSMATPHVAGACAFMWSMNPALSHLQVKQIILDTVDKLGALDGLCVTGGRLNLYSRVRPKLEKVDDVNGCDCRWPGDEINYRIDYNYPAGPNLPDINDVNLIDYLPDEVDFNSASGDCNWGYDPCSRTVTWHIGTLSPGSSGSVTLKVKVNESAALCGAITNMCELKSGDQVLNIAHEYTSVCCNCVVLEDFDSYADTDALWDVWKVDAGAIVYLNADPGLARDGHSMQYYYDNYYRFYSEAYADIATLPSQIGSDWSAGEALTLYFYGQADNDVSEPMYVKLTDGDNPAHSKTVNYDGDMNDIRKEEWQEWSIALSNFTGVNLAKVSRITIGLGNGIEELVEDKGTVYFDDIQMCRRIALGKTASFEGDCVGPGKEITYTIDYNNLNGTVDDVNIIDYLPDEVEFVSSVPEPNEIIDSNKIVWHIGTLSPGESGFVTLKVNVKCAGPGGTITNCSKIKSGDQVRSIACEDTPVCCCPTLTKVDDVPDGSCVVPDANITYSICYAANGYGDTNVKIIDDLPTEVDYISSDPCGDYNPGSHTVTWRNINFPPNASGCVKLVVKVNMKAEPGGKITNHCELKGCCLDLSADKNTHVCVWCPIYVDVNANGWNNGYLWENAFTNLQDALEAAQRCLSAGCPCEEIRVAEGTYKPDEGTGVEPNDREATFELINGVAIKGGYAGFGKPDPNARDIGRYETILSGDLKGNDRQCVDLRDLLDDPFRADNSYHVVTGSGVINTAVLDGFTITGGNADGNLYNYPNDVGGGMYNDSNSTITNCKFIENSAQYGGGIYNTGEPNAINCTFIRNAAQYGGGICELGAPGSPSSPSIAVTNCTFVENIADGGGGIYALYSSATVTNCILWDNSPEQIVNYGSASVTYSDIEGGWEGAGNIDEDPMLESDGYHLTLCSPCIDAGTNTPPGGLPAADIDGEERIMNGRCVGEDVVDMGADEYYLEDCNILLYAHCPRPSCGAADVPVDVVLSWRPGIDANTHDVYFGTDKIKVTDANRDNQLGVLVSYDQNDNTYDPCGLLDLDRTYYWRIDEVNDACEPYLWEGDVWHFRTRNYLVVEDFDSYAWDDALWAVWKRVNNVAIYLQLGKNDANLVRDGNSMQYQYDNYGQPYFEAYANTAALPSGIGSNWTAGGVKALVLWFYGYADNDANEPMYVKLTDGGSPAKTAKVIYDGDMNDIKKEEWQEWNIALTEFTGVNLANVSRITIGIGNGIAELVDDMGTVYFEDIRLYVPRCIPERPTADLNWDCVVDFRDFAVLANEWLDTGCCEADLYEDYKVDFKDLAIMADNWLEEGQMRP
jgi:subtilisin family serine protease